MAKDKNNPSVHGVGFVGQGIFKTGTSTKKSKAYDSWNAMIRRCYDKKATTNQPAYIGCTVDKIWHNYQNFALWYKENSNSSMQGRWELDKDILIKGNKVYSPDTCCLVPKDINVMILSNKKNRGELPLGVSRAGTKFTAQMRVNNIQTNLGFFNTPEEAFIKYKEEKEAYIKRQVQKFKGIIADRVYEKLINYKIEITD